MRRIDLHAHTKQSDGTLSPTELVRLAVEIGLSALAVTDHDSTSGIDEALHEGKLLGLEVLVGCEISAAVTSGVVHVLAWGFDPADRPLQAFLARVRDARELRNAEMLERLADCGAELTMEEVRQHAHGSIVARPHFAQALVARGIVPDVRAAFDEYLRDGGRAYVVAKMPLPHEAITAVASAGGVTAVAHPRQIRIEGREPYFRLFAELRESGLTGIEVDHPSHKPEHRAFFASIAAELDLVATGGSDFHGANKKHIALGSGDGTIHVPYETWDRLKARRRG